MSKKAVLTTFITAIIIVAIVGTASFLVAKNRPSADVAAPPVPPVPSHAPANYPPVPPVYRLKGDANNDGIVNVLDLSVIISNWQQIDAVHNLVDDISGKANFINALDLSQVITYWKCTELKPGCDYYIVTPAPAQTPVITPTPSPSGTATLSPTSTATTTSTATASPAQEYVVRRGRTEKIGNYPFSLMYYADGASGYFYTYIALNTSAIDSKKCVSRFQTFSAGSYTAIFACGSSQYTITLNTGKSDSNKITVTVVEKPLASVTATLTSTVVPSPTKTSTCTWYRRLVRQCY